MAKVGGSAGASSVNSKSSKSELPFRRFSDRPVALFIESVLQHLRDTAQPETMEALFRNQIPKDVEFFIIRQITLDGPKRPNGDNAPCPMCTTNRFLSGALIHIPSMQCCAVIGHCCADKKSQAAAAREFKQRSRRDYDETYLLENLPLVEARLKALGDLKSVAVEARRLYRQFRKEASRVQFQLRQVKRNYAGQLILHEIIRGGEDDERNNYVGPAGFKGRGPSDIETREHNFGTMAGDIATIKNYDPVQELETLLRQLGSIDTVPNENELLDFIVRINEKQRTAAVIIMETVDRGVLKFVERLRSFLAFFTHENAGLLNAFGTSRHNSLPFEVSFGLMKERPAVLIKCHQAKCVLHVGEAFYNFQFSWPMKAK